MFHDSRPRLFRWFRILGAAALGTLFAGAALASELALAIVSVGDESLPELSFVWPKDSEFRIDLSTDLTDWYTLEQEDYEVLEVRDEDGGTAQAFLIRINFFSEDTERAFFRVKPCPVKLTAHRPGTLEMPGALVPDDLEEDPANLILCVNDDSDEGRMSSADYLPDHADEVIGPTDDDITKLTLELDPSGLEEGTVTLIVQPGLRAFDEAGIILEESDLVVDLSNPEGKLAAIKDEIVTIFVECVEDLGGGEAEIRLEFDSEKLTCDDIVRAAIDDVEIDVRQARSADPLMTMLPDSSEQGTGIILCTNDDDDDLDLMADNLDAAVTGTFPQMLADIDDMAMLELDQTAFGGQLKAGSGRVYIKKLSGTGEVRIFDLNYQLILTTAGSTSSTSQAQASDLFNKLLGLGTVYYLEGVRPGKLELAIEFEHEDHTCHDIITITVLKIDLNMTYAIASDRGAQPFLDRYEEAFPFPLCKNDDDDDLDRTPDHQDTAITGSAAQKAADRADMATLKLEQLSASIDAAQVFIRQLGGIGRVRIFRQSDDKLILTTTGAGSVTTGAQATALFNTLKAGTETYRVEGIKAGNLELAIEFKKDRITCRDRIRMTVIEVDMTISLGSVVPPGREEADGLSLCVNDDDDNGDGIPDHITPVTDGPLDRLDMATLVLNPPVPATAVGNVSIKKIGGGPGNVWIFEGLAPFAPVLTTPTPGGAVVAVPFPKTFIVEGVDPGELHLAMEFESSGFVCRDLIKITVFGNDPTPQHDVAITPDGTTGAARVGSRIGIYDMDSGELRGSGAFAVGGSGRGSDWIELTDTRAIALGGAQVQIYDLTKTPPELIGHHTFPADENAEHDVAVTPDGTIGAARAGDRIGFYEMDSGDELGVLSFNPGEVGQGSDWLVMTNSRAIAIGGEQITIFDLTSAPPAVVADHAFPVEDDAEHDVSVTPDGTIAVARVGDLIGFYDMVSGDELTVEGFSHGNVGEGADWLALTDTRAIALGGAQIKIFDLTSNPPAVLMEHTFPDNPGVNHDVSVTPDGLIGVARAGDRIGFYEMGSGVELTNASFNPGNVGQGSDWLALTNTRGIALGGSQVRIFDLTSELPAVLKVHSLPGNADASHDVCVAPDGMIGVVRGGDRIGFYDMVSGEEISVGSFSLGNIGQGSDWLASTDTRAIALGGPQVQIFDLTTNPPSLLGDHILPICP